MLKIYSTQTCKYCDLAKEYFDENNIPYEVLDVGMNRESRKDMVELSGQLGVPVIQFNSTFMVGWDEDKFKELYEDNSSETKE